ncbi:MAG: branched-chain amino acid ABC transporter permease [Desulfurococcales archaeon]|nr:branched-chain amino acid ABC transporter permease [Desulfurococcales archaeon]
MVSTIPIVALVDGLALGLSLFLLSSGLTIVFGLLGIVNFAHGSLFMWGAYIGYYVASTTGSFSLGIIAGLASMAIIGGLIKIGLLRDAHERPLAAAMLTIGLMFLFDRLALLIWGESTRMWGPRFLDGTISIGNIIFYKYRLFLIGVGIILFSFIYLLIKYSSFGIIVRAGIQDKEMVEALGINFDRVATWTFMLGAGLAGMSGFFFVPWIGVNPSTGMTFLLYAFAIVVIGGIESIEGTLIASIIVGIIQQYTMYYLPWLAEAVIFVLMLIVLLIKPYGLTR